MGYPIKIDYGNILVFFIICTKTVYFYYLCLMYTYILKSQGYYKIGMAINLEKRLKSYSTHNPVWELVYSLPFNCEKYLHFHFDIKRFKHEWFSLSIDDLHWIKSNEDYLFNKQNFFQTKKEKEESVWNKKQEKARKRIDKEKNETVQLLKSGMINTNKMKEFIHKNYYN